MISEINNTLLIKYLRHELTENERQAVLHWLEEKEENQEFLFGLKEAYQLSQWKELRIRSGAATGWEEINEQIEKTNGNCRQLQRKRLLAYVAAAVILLLIGFALRDLTQTSTPVFNALVTANGEQSTLLLNDGTKVKLNENSKLVYPSGFSGKNRDVTLRGEAYFEVSHDSQHPFQVNIGTYTIRVLGTKFNVDAYPDQVYVYTSLKNGRIQIVENSKEAKILADLKPGMQLSYNKRTGEYFVKSVDSGQIADWTNGMLVMKRQTLEEVAERLQQKYGYAIKIEDNKISKLTYNITIEHESLEEILSNIHFITPQVHYSINNRNKTVILK